MVKKNLSKTHIQPQSKASGGSEKRSNTSDKMRGKKSEVDETLFGANTTKKTQQQRINDPQTQKIIQSVRSGDLTSPELVVIGESELQRMKVTVNQQYNLNKKKNNAIITSKEEQLYQKKLLEEQKEKQQAAAKAKKQRMLQMEEEKKKQVPLSDQQLEDKVVKDSLLARAQEVMNERLDDVKEMNKMVMYAKCVTIRDKQLEEKKNVYGDMKTQEKRKDLMMEIDRLKMIKHYETLDKIKKEEQKKGHLVIIDQIKERELSRLKDKEEQEREGQVMLHKIDKLQKEEGENALKKKFQQKILQDEILEANDRAVVVKQKRIYEEKEEEEKIVKYNMEKAQKEAEYVAEQRRLKEEKEREVQRLREMQEKANDRQAELDALRAKRAMEQNERQARDKERREAELRMNLNHELLEARKLQTYEKQERLQEQAKMERDEFQRIIQKQKLERENEIKLAQEREALIKKHADELRKQISLNEEKMKQEERDKLEEGKKIRDKLQAEKKLIENIKDKKLKQLHENSIPDKYKAELAKKKIQI